MAIPKLPKSVRIAGDRWRVICRREVFLDGEPCDGVCHYPERVLEIAVGSNDEHAIMSAFYHEALHAIIHAQAPTIDPDLEHSIIAGIEKWFAANTALRARPLKPKPTKLAPPKSSKPKRSSRRGR